MEVIKGLSRLEKEFLLEVGYSLDHLTVGSMIVYEDDEVTESEIDRMYRTIFNVARRS